MRRWVSGVVLAYCYGERFYQALRLYFQQQEAHTGRHAQKAASDCHSAKKPSPPVKPILPVPLAVIPPLNGSGEPGPGKPGRTTL